MVNALACGKCGNSIASDLLQSDFGGNCPWCLAAFALGVPPAEDLPLVAGAKASDRLGKYLLTEKLGTGGMGEVWKALDTELNRWVALKFLKDQDPKELARFTREAHMAAKLSHPSIAAVYEIGEIAGRHYIAMQCIEGRTLETFPRNDRRLLVRLCLDAAKALDHAHRHGVIHRDVKPGNLMVEEIDEGMKVVVLDFGLARSIEGGEKLSMSGSVVGTPQYLSPEQARAEKLDERSDVYSLGVTMYELFTGKTPFEGANVYEILKKIENEEPVAPRKIKPQINQDLQTIILKCLEKNRERRYAGAKELAYDLKRFLNHEAVLARPPSTIYRLKMKLAKRKAVLATAAIASMALAAALGWWLLVGGPGAEHHRLMAVGMKLWDEARVSAVTGGDSDDIRKKAKAAREGFESAILAHEETEAQMMRGRCLELEGQDTEALKALERAYELDPGNVEARVELAKALFLSYQDSRGMPMTLTQRGHGATNDEAKFDDLRVETDGQRKLRERGEKLLAEGKVAPAQEHLLNGLLAMGKGVYRQAARELAIYTKSARWDSQTLRLEGLCRYFDRDFPGAIAAFDLSLSRVPHALGFNWRGMVYSITGFHGKAIEDYTRAIELDSKCGEAYLNRGSAKADSKLLDEAITDYNKAIDLDPKRAASYFNRGGARKGKGLHVEALEDYNKAIELDRTRPEFYTNRAEAWLGKGLFDKAIADLDKAIEMDPKNASACTNRGVVKCDLGRLDEAILDHTKAIELNSKYAVAYFNRGVAYQDKSLFGEAIADYTKAIDLGLKQAMVHNNRGNARRAKGLHEEAMADYDEAITLDPKYAMAYHNRGAAKQGKGLVDEAILDFDESIKLDPNYAKSHYLRGISRSGKGLQDDAIRDFDKAIELDSKYTKAYLDRGVAKGRKGHYDEAIEDFNKALELDGTFSAAFHNRGLAKSFKALHAEAIADFSKAIELDPVHATSHFNRGVAKKAMRQLDEAIEDFDESIKRNPNHADAYLNRGFAKNAKGSYDDAILDFTKVIELNFELAKAHGARGNAYADKGLHEDAIKDFTKAIELDSKNVAAYNNRAISRGDLGRHAEAIEDFDKAIELDPKDATCHYNRARAKEEMNLLDEAIAAYDQAIKLDPKYWDAFCNRGAVKWAKGRVEEAIVDWKKAFDLAPPDSPHRTVLQELIGTRGERLNIDEGHRLHGLKKFREAIAKHKAFIDSYPKSTLANASAYSIACGYALLGEKKNALDWLEKSVTMGWSNLAHLEKDADMESLRKEDRYLKLTEKLRAK